MPKNCWRNSTPLETGLGLALIVSASFLLIMIIVYLAADTSVGTLFGPKYYNCKKACACITDFSKLLFFPLNPDKHTRLSDYSLGGTDLQPFAAHQSELQPTFCLGKNYSIGSIVKQRYVDNLKYFEFISPAAILSAKWLLSSTSVEYDRVDSVYATIGSKYWSKSGYLHKVQTIIPVVDSLILFKLEADIIINMEFMNLIGELNIQTVTITTWDPAYKHKKARETNVSVVSGAQCGNDSFCTVADANFDATEMHASLAINNDGLLGFYNQTLCYQYECLYKFQSIKPYIFKIMLHVRGNTL